jgi:hypothetical protein
MFTWFLNLILWVAVFEMTALSPKPVQWDGAGNYRLLVEVPAVDIGKRKSDELPADIILDFSGLLREKGIPGKVNLASLQVMKFDPTTGQALRYLDYAYARSRFDRPFRWYDGSIPYDFPEVSENIDRTNGEIRRQKRLRAGYFYNVIGDGEKGHLAWSHTQKSAEPSYYAIYFNLLGQGEAQQMPPRGWLGDGMQRCDQWTESSTAATHSRVVIDDWNDDGLFDLVFGEVYGHLFWFPNMGTRKKPEFPPYYQMVFDAEGLPIDSGVVLAPLIVDWDGDGRKDLIAGSEWNRVVFYKNVGSNRERKLMYQGFLKADGATLILPTTPMRRGSEKVFTRDYYPVFDAVDWDADGDVDLIAGGYITGRIFFYENVGRESSGLPILKFSGPLKADGEILNVRDWCAAPSVHDFDGDGDLDIISGNMPVTKGGGDSSDTDHFLRYYENTGSQKKPLLKERPFPKSGTFARGRWATPRAADWDGDGDLDLVVSAWEEIYLYENIGDTRHPKFRVDTTPLRSHWGTADLGGGVQTSTQFLDWNGDGKLDLVSDYKVWLNTGKGNPGVYERSPISVLPTGVHISHPSGIGDDWFWPRLYDLDQDGKLDVLFGDWSGRIWFHKNLSTPQEKHFDTKGYTLRLSTGEELKVGPIGIDPRDDFDALQGARTVFVVADFDQDKLYDLVVGDTYGKVRYYQNVGTRESPVFSAPVEVGDHKNRLMVDATDWNQDGRMDIMACAVNEIARVYLNIGSKGEARFDKGFDPGLPPIIQPRVTMVDLNSDGDLDLFIPGIQGSSFVERSFLRHGYAQGKVLDFGTQAKGSAVTGEKAGPRIVERDSRGSKR